MNFTIGAIALAVAAAVGSWGGYKATSLHYEHVIDKAAAEARAAVDAANLKAQRAGADYEMWKANNRPKTITITREIEREVQADSDCSQRALPSGLRDSLAAAATDADQLVTHSAVPAASSANAYDLGRLGARLRGLAGGVGGLPRAASSPR